jgi:phospholipase/carboxylesterase
LSGGLIGDVVDPDSYEGDLESTPVFFGCSDVDPHIPEERVHESAAVFERLGGEVTTRIYEGMGHGVNEDELGRVSELVADLVA